MKTKLVLMSLLLMLVCQSGYGQTPDHPRLLVTQDELSTLWTRVNQSGTPAATLWGKLQQRCNNAQQYPPYGNERWYDYRQISMLAFAALLLRQSSDPGDLALAKSYTNTALDYCQTYVLPDTDIEEFPVVHRIKNLALVYDYLYYDSTFTVSLKTDIENKILTDMSITRDRINRPRNRFLNNHGAFHCEALLYGAIALEGIETYPPQSAQVDVDRVKTCP
jgi:hypothetical protein